MAILPKATTQVSGPYQSTTQPINIEAWTAQAAESLNAVSLSSAGGVRGTSVSLAIPLDEQAAAKRTAATNEERRTLDASKSDLPRREPLRRDSLKRREALLKGKEGSRRRQRWENGSYQKGSRLGLGIDYWAFDRPFIEQSLGSNASPVGLGGTSYLSEACRAILPGPLVGRYLDRQGYR